MENTKKQNGTTYNGWKNRSTWNVALWINNDEPLYRSACNYMRTHKDTKKPYAGFIRSMWMQDDKTPDGIKWISNLLDYEALNEMMKEMID